MTAAARKAATTKRKATVLADPKPATTDENKENEVVAPRKGLLPRTPAAKAKASTKAAASKKAAAAKKKAADAAAAREAEEEAPKHPAKRVKKSPASQPQQEGAAEQRQQEEMPSRKRAAATTTTTNDTRTKHAKSQKELPILTTRSVERLTVFMFGTGENGELGLGPLPNAKEVKRPRKNDLLDVEKVGIVAVATGGMHSLALSHDGVVYSWGVNDQSALGRDTTADVKVRDVGSGDDSDSDDEVSEQMNRLESTPMPVEGFPEGTEITRIAAGDSISVAVTQTGQVYGWGTFRAADGLLGFTEKTSIAKKPTLIPELKDIVDVTTGNDHVLVLDKTGHVYAWGNGQQNQLGRRVVERTRMNALHPRPVVIARRKIKSIHSGNWHSFAITTDSTVYAWGLNNYGQTGIYEDDGEGLHTVHKPTVVEQLAQYNVVDIAAGQSHTIALTSDGALLAWGRMDAHQVGVDASTVPEEDIIKDVAGKNRLLIAPTNISGDRRFVKVACGIDHSIAIAEDGTAWSWGYGSLYQVGQGPPGNDIPTPTKIVNTATTNVKMKLVACGGNFSCLAGRLPPPQMNGTST